MKSIEGLHSTEQADDEAVAREVAGWVAEHGDRLFRYALFRVRNRELAEDLVQDTLLAAFRSRESFEGRSSPYTWLVTILKNKIIDHVRKNSRAPTVSLDDGFQDERGELFNRLGLWATELNEWDGGAEALIERKDFRLQLEQCLQKMPEKLRQAFIFKVIDGMESEAICEALQVSPNNLWVMLYRSRMRLRKCLDTNWFSRGGEA
ncbi:MAG: sigma-70 family RNA polymerase sigma factor [Bdellovibrionales bacterium]|nr:sigma-70 family RNA polymerase sigma factor [Bdellovibrionales bacterium]